jgi:hypothetical protein
MVCRASAWRSAAPPAQDTAERGDPADAARRAWAATACEADGVSGEILIWLASHHAFSAWSTCSASNAYHLETPHLRQVVLEAPIRPAMPEECRHSVVRTRQFLFGKAQGQILTQVEVVLVG